MAKTKAKRPKTDNVKKLATKIARDIMTPVGSDLVYRLDLIADDGRNMGGWALNPLAKRIEQHLRGEV